MLPLEESDFDIDAPSSHRCPSLLPYLGKIWPSLHCLGNPSFSVVLNNLANKKALTPECSGMASVISAAVTAEGDLL